MKTGAVRVRWVVFSCVLVLCLAALADVTSAGGRSRGGRRRSRMDRFRSRDWSRDLSGTLSRVKREYTHVLRKHYLWFQEFTWCVREVVYQLIAHPTKDHLYFVHNVTQAERCYPYFKKSSTETTEGTTSTQEFSLLSSSAHISTVSPLSTRRDTSPTTVVLISKGPHNANFTTTVKAAVTPGPTSESSTTASTTPPVMTSATTTPKSTTASTPASTTASTPSSTAASTTASTTTTTASTTTTTASTTASTTTASRTTPAATTSTMASTTAPVAATSTTTLSTKTSKTTASTTTPSTTSYPSTTASEVTSAVTTLTSSTTRLAQTTSVSTSQSETTTTTSPPATTTPSTASALVDNVTFSTDQSVTASFSSTTSSRTATVKVTTRANPRTTSQSTTGTVTAARMVTTARSAAITKLSTSQSATTTTSKTTTMQALDTTPNPITTKTNLNTSPKTLQASQTRSMAAITTSTSLPTSTTNAPVLVTMRKENKTGKTSANLVPAGARIGLNLTGKAQHGASTSLRVSFCSSSVRLTNGTMASHKLQCPSSGHHSDETHCCGPSGQQNCCNFADKYRVIIVFIVFCVLLLPLVGYLLFRLLKRKCKQKAVVVACTDVSYATCDVQTSTSSLDLRAHAPPPYQQKATPTALFDAARGAVYLTPDEIFNSQKANEADAVSLPPAYESVLEMKDAEGNQYVIPFNGWEQFDDDLLPGSCPQTPTPGNARRNSDT